MNWGINPWNYTLAEYGTHTSLFVFEYFLGERGEKKEAAKTATPIRPLPPQKRLSASLSRLHLPIHHSRSGRMSSQV